MTKKQRRDLGDGLQAAPEMVRTVPKRIQLSRRKGYRKPEGAVVVDRRTKWGNHAYPTRIFGRAEAVRRFEVLVLANPGLVAIARRELRGKDLCCWCPLSEPCHADVWLRVANSEGV